VSLGLLFAYVDFHHLSLARSLHDCLDLKVDDSSIKVAEVNDLSGGYLPSCIAFSL